EAAAGSGSVAVSISGGCAFTATSDVSWIGSVATTASGVSFAVEANDGPERIGTLTIASAGGAAQYAIVQANGCAISLGTTSVEADGFGDALDVDVLTGVGCTWTASSSNAWITIGTTEEIASLWFDQNEGALRVGEVTFTADGSGATATLTISQPYLFEPPSIWSHPLSQIHAVGETLGLSVGAGEGDAPSLTFQWRKDGVDIPGETFPTLWVEDLTLEDAGEYDVVVSNLAGSVTSEVARLTVTSPDGGCSISTAGARGSSGPLGAILAAVFLIWARRRPKRGLPAGAR
ncbi:MAG: immunoglobulin domain-containing protein, partial [Polyangiaceae bacterium]|nr:immunoglobulin domain-containing protein [Polyangiaceae bacterium]